MTGHQATMKFGKAEQQRVISGSSAPKAGSKTLAKAGMTKILTMTMATAIAITTNIG
jgi:hypothetical protein